MNIDTFHSFRLREEARKSWDYLFSNELVYAVDLGEVDGKFERGYIERYRGSEFHLEFTLRYGGCYYSAIVESARTVDSRHTTIFNDRLTKARGNFPMFINAINLMEQPEMVNISPIPSVIRLKAFNNLLGFGRDTPHFWDTRFFEIVGRIENGELCTAVRFLGREACKLPGKMVECRPQVKSDITNDYTPTDRGFPVHLKPKDFLGIFGIILWNERIWFGLREPEHLDFPIEKIEMFLRPDDFEPNAVQRMHMLYYTPFFGNVIIPSPARRLR